MFRLYFWNLIALTVLYFCLVESAENSRPVEWLKVVPFPILGRGLLTKIYIEARKKNNKTYDKPQENIEPDVKKRICTNIFTSGQFDGMMEPLDMDKWYRAWMLRFQHPELLQHLKDTNSTSPSGSPFSYPTEPLTVFVSESPRTLANVNEEKPEPETGFLCLARHLRTKEIFDAYISEEYDMNFGLGDRKVGRFIFAKDLDSDRLVLNYLAEEPAKVTESDFDKIQERYEASRKDTTTEIDVRNHPICKLDPLECSQVCASVLNSAFFEGKIKYVPNKREIPDCSSMLVRINFNFSSQEWTLKCKGKTTNPEEEVYKYIEYYVTRGETDKDVFVHTVDPSNVFMLPIVNISTNVRNVPRLVV